MGSENTLFITTSQELASFCARLSEEEFITVDTEFMREKTYFAKLCLVQVGGSHAAAAIDPLAPGIDLSPLYALLANPRILKVFHAARQDIEIFVEATGTVPTPLFDTQIAAMVCGFGESASYETLANRLAGAIIDKSSRYTDWSARPLTPKQITYALGDVTHLRQVYLKLNEQLAKSGRTEWLAEEMAVLNNLATYTPDPQEAWKKLRLKLDKPKLRAMLRELTAWREIEAKKLNVPRGRILKDEMLLEIAHHAPQTSTELARTRGLHSGFAEGRQGQEILEAIARVNSLPASEYPAGTPKRILPTGSGAVLDLLKVLLKHASDESGVASKLIATTDDLEDLLLATTAEPDLPILRGWRRTLFGEQALALIAGKLALALDKTQKLKLVIL